MLVYLNFICLIAASAASAILYIKSVSPAQLERKTGEVAYLRCARYRMGALIAGGLAVINFVLNRSFPLANWMAAPFSWPQWVSFIFALLFGLPALALMITGIQDMGSEWLTPAKKNKLVTKGIYKKIRHPQAYKGLLWPALAFGLQSPLLLVISVPLTLIEVIKSMAEEIDLIIRFGEAYLKYRDKTGMFIPKDKTAREIILKFISIIKGLVNTDKGSDV